MKKLTLLLLTLASMLLLFAGSTAIAREANTGVSNSGIEFNREALFNQDGEFRGCPYSGNDCARVIIIQID